MAQPADKVIGLVVYDGMAALDIVGPYEVLASLGPHGLNAGYRTLWVAETLDAVTAHQGLAILPEAFFSEAPKLDVIVVPGGPGQVEQADNPKFISFLQEAADRAEWICSVCTGSLLLAKAGLLTGKQATTHWMAMAALEDLGAIAVKRRVVKQGNIITAAGVSAGIDMALTLAAELAGPKAAQVIQLNIEYDPEPPFNSGSPDKAPPDVVDVFSLPRARATQGEHR